MIQAGAEIGLEAPVTVENCAVGRRVKLRGGYHSGAVFLDDAVFGSGAQVRAGTLLEEEANAAHTVGLKQTVLLPFVTLGSLINFCDILMAGGTSRRDHSEVGSSFIHFNFTPFGKSGDKATPSLVGDVPQGVMLRAKRIFLGGQGGLVGPIHIDYGTVLAAGYVYRRDQPTDRLVVGEALPTHTRSFDPRQFRRIRSKVDKNLRYIGNLVALCHWYQQVRLRLADTDADKKALYRRAMGALDVDIKERISRLKKLAGDMEASIASLQTLGDAVEKEIGAQRHFAENFDQMERHLRRYANHGLTDSPKLATLLEGLTRAAEGGKSYTDVIKALDDESAAQGTAWLEQVVKEVMSPPKW